MATPAEVYRVSERAYEGTPADLDYGVLASRRVQVNGMISFHKEQIRISASLAGWSVGWRPVDEGRIQEVCFAETYLGYLDPQVPAFFPAKSPMEPPPDRRPPRV
jgi:hypothetical protein